MQPDVTALATCCREALAAANGHGRRWAVERCKRALQAPTVKPADPRINAQCALAMAAVAQAIDAAARKVSPLRRLEA